LVKITHHLWCACGKFDISVGYLPDILTTEKFMARIKFLLFLLMASGIFVASCEKNPLESLTDPSGMIINSNLLNLSQRVTTVEGGLLLPFHDETVGARLKSGTYHPKYQIYLRAEVDPPVYNGSTLQASHIKMTGGYAFVTYNTRGPEYLGGVDVFDIRNIEKPLLVQSVVFPKRDINSIDVEPAGDGENNFIYLTGATDLYFDQTGMVSPAFVQKFTASQASHFMHLQQPAGIFDLESFAGNDVRCSGGNSIFVTSGSGGGLSILNGGMVRTGYVPVTHARSIDTDGVVVAVYSAHKNRLIIMDMEGIVLREITTGGDHFAGDEYLEAKSIVRLKDNLAFVATGTGGMEVFDINTGVMKASLPRPKEYKNAEIPLNYVTNGVSVNDNLILTANGGAGVHVAEFTDAGGIGSIGSLMFETGSSANFVEASGNKVFVATGKGGLKILEIVELEQTEPCVTLWDRIVELLPEQKTIHNSGHPSHDLSMSGLPGTVRLTGDGPVYITFIHNGAGWNNSFGYYTYQEGNAPSTPDEIEKIIIYPFVNRDSNGKLRQQGERVRLGADNKIFPAGTVIGFYVVTQGWDNPGNQMVAGLYTVYSTPAFNPEGIRKHVLFLEESCLNIVLGFEDRLTGSDEDFNDIIFTISNGDDIWGNEHNQFIDKEGLPVK
jgi:hypothetical protein